jgi:uncharacterized membrane protein
VAGQRFVALSVGIVLLSLTILLGYRPANAATTYTINQLNAFTGVVNAYGSSANRTIIAGEQFTNPARGYIRSGGADTIIGSGSFTHSWGFDANDSAQAVGFLTNTFQGFQPGDRAFIHTGGSVVQLPVLGTTNYTHAYSINNAGVIVGRSDSKPYSVLFGAPSLTQLPNPAGADGTGAAESINTGGEIVGWAGVAGVRMPARWSSGGGVLLNLPPGAISAEATLINDADVIAGEASYPTIGKRAFFYDVGGFAIDMGTLPGQNQTEVFDINASRQAIGVSHNVPVGPPTPFFSENGIMVDLNTLLPANSGWVLRTALTINDAGEITGTGLFHNVSSGFKLTPSNVPEPLAGALTALLAGAWVLRRRGF